MEPGVEPHGAQPKQKAEDHGSEWECDLWQDQGLGPAKRPDGGRGRAWGLGDKKELLSLSPPLMGHSRVKPTQKGGLG